MKREKCPICGLNLEIVEDELKGVVGYTCDNDHYAHYLTESLLPVVYVIGKEKFSYAKYKNNAKLLILNFKEEIQKEKKVWKEKLAEKSKMN